MGGNEGQLRGPVREVYVQEIFEPLDVRPELLSQFVAQIRVK